MPSAYITDLIDHKQRVAKYMQVAAMEFFRRENDISAPYVDCINDSSNLFDLTELVANNQELPLGQTGAVCKNTLGYFAESQIHHCWLGYALSDLFHRATVHDNSKFSPEEFDLYEQAFPELQKYAYGTTEYKAAVKLLGPAWKHHCLVNDHHPEYFDTDIAGMHCVQLIEMCCDWIAASEQSQTDIMTGLQKNKERFGIDDQLFTIIRNTIVELRKEQ